MRQFVKPLVTKNYYFVSRDLYKIKRRNLYMRKKRMSNRNATKKKLQRIASDCREKVVNPEQLFTEKNKEALNQILIFLNEKNLPINKKNIDDALIDLIKREAEKKKELQNNIKKHKKNIENISKQSPSILKPLLYS